MLANDDPADFFAARRTGKRGADRDWIDWYYAFALLLRRDFALAADVLLPLSVQARDALVAGLAAFFLEDTLAKALPARSAELVAAAAAARDRVLAKLPTKAAWDKEIDRGGAAIHIVVLNKSLAEAGARFYA